MLSRTFYYRNSIRTKKGYRKACSLVVLACMLAFWGSVPVYAQQSNEERIDAQRAMPIQSNETENWPNGPVVNAESAILMEAETGTILYAKNIHKQEYPASTTKILTCLIALEQCSLDEVVTFSHSAVFDIPRDSSHIGIDVGEELTMEQSLSGILIASANEVAFGVAEHISGTWQDFSAVMNERALELGCLNSNFVNPNGLPDDNHYTTAYDLAMIGRAFFDQELLCKLSSTYRLDLPATDKQPHDIVAHSKNQLLPTRAYAYEYLVGSKTGYTDAARNSLVSCAEKDGMKLICVVFKDESPLQFEDTVTLFDYGFSNFEKVNVSEAETKYNIENKGFFYSNREIFGSSKPILSLNKEDCIVLPKNIRFEDTSSSISYVTSEENQIALITYSYNGVSLGTASVNLAQPDTAAYTFDTPMLPSATEEVSIEEDAKGPSVIFINIMKVFLCAAVIISILFVLLVIRAFLKNYAISTPYGRRRRHRRPMRRQPHQPDFNTLSERRRAQVRKVNKKNRRAKRANRFRDYDY